MSYDNDNKGVLFHAKEKKTDKHPDYDGNITIDGVEYWLSGWKRTSAKGTQFLSLTVKPKQAQQPQQSKRPSQDAAKARDTRGGASGFDDFGDDSVPF